MPNEAVLYTTIAAVHRHRQDLVADTVAEPSVEATAPAAEVETVHNCIWQPISCGVWSQVHICAEIDRQTSEARLRMIVWVLESGAVIVNDILGIGCRWWQSACDDRAFRRLTGVDGRTYGLQFRSVTKAIECSRIVDRVLTNPDVVKVVRKLMRANADLQGLVMAWQGVGLRSTHYPSRILDGYLGTSSPPSSPSRTLGSVPRARQCTIYPKQHYEARGSWRGEEQQQEAEGRVLPPHSFATFESAEPFLGPERDSSLADEGNNQTEDHSNGALTSPVVLLETGGTQDMELQLASLKKRSRGDLISCPYKTRAEIHVTYDAEHARYEGLPEEWRTLNLQFGLPLEQVPKREVEGYEAKVPAVLEMMKTCLLSHNGARTEGVFRLAPDQKEYNEVKAAINDGSFEDCSDVHIMASLIKVWYRELPVSLFDMLPEQQIALTCELVDPDPKVVLQSLRTLPPLHQTAVLWLLDLLNEVVKHEHKNKMTAKSMAIVIAPNLLTLKTTDAAVVVTTYRQVADFVQLLLRARLQSR
ncbi:hypothetical protein V7S43_013910 [Phytophthora oleae]|uniref:Rho-GAP domain-containing protein n=1 Tax=Phytophthora oleae TaxID=2107226 RepID=A0ABD3F2F7_9STRA